MTSKKQKRPQAAQQLIDSLLDEKTTSAVGSYNGNLSDETDPVLSGPSARGSRDVSAPTQSPQKNEGEASKSDDFEIEIQETFSARKAKVAPPPPPMPRDEQSLEELDREVDAAFDLAFDQNEIVVPDQPADQSGRQSGGRSGGHSANQSSSDAPSDENERTIRLSLEERNARKSSQPPVGEETRSKLSLVANDPRSMPSPDLPPVDAGRAGTSAMPGARNAAKTPVEPQVPRALSIDRSGLTEIRSSSRPLPGGTGAKVRSHTSVGPSGPFSSAEASLKQSENLRIAQTRISELEHELERIRRENEMLASAGETLRRRTDEMISRTESLEGHAKESARTFEEEKKLLRGQLQLKDRENLELRNKMEEMEGRLEANFKKIRVRERELEHRLEIIKMESATLVSTKDKMILELKRQIDQMQNEQEYAQSKTQELFNQFKDKQDTNRRVVRALRIALTILEGDEDQDNSPKKSD